MYNPILEEAKVFATALFDQFCNFTFVFHNIQHTENVVERATQIAGYYNLDDDEKSKLIIAAWFHDTGYLFTQPDIHEQKSVDIMRGFLKGKPVQNGFIETVEDCILATRFPTAPQTLLQQILCDADTYHLGTKAFLKSNEQVFAELHFRDNMLTRKDFDKKTLILLTSHIFYTSYCVELLSENKRKNMDFIKQKISVG